MKVGLTFLFVLFLTTNAFSQLPGKYSKKGKDFTHTLSLNADSSFSFSMRALEVNSVCNGKWKVMSKKKLILTCAESTLEEKLQSGYMNQREIQVHILKNNRLKVDKVVMRKS